MKDGKYVLITSSSAPLVIDGTVNKLYELKYFSMLPDSSTTGKKNIDLNIALPLILVLRSNANINENTNTTGMTTARSNAKFPIANKCSGSDVNIFLNWVNPNPVKVNFIVLKSVLPDVARENLIDLISGYNPNAKKPIIHGDVNNNPIKPFFFGCCYNHPIFY